MLMTARSAVQRATGHIRVQAAALQLVTSVYRVYRVVARVSLIVCCAPSGCAGELTRTAFNIPALVWT